MGDGNNVAHSLLLAGAKAAMTVRVATPVGFEPIPQVVERAEEIAAETGGSIEVGTDPAAAATGAHVLYTDVWASMGQEAEAEERALIFRPYQLNEALIAVADPDVLVMHCMPAHRGDEISDGAIDGDRSVVVDQAENRLHTQKSLLVLLLGSRRERGAVAPWFERPASVVAPALIGRHLVRRFADGARCRVRIVETEAYEPDDPASHSRSAGRPPATPRCSDPAGHLYVYLSYGSITA